MTRTVRGIIWGAVLIAASYGLVACGSDSGSSGSFTDAAKNSAKISPAIPASGCGAVPVPAPSDPDGVLDTLAPSYKTTYAGYQPTIHKSVWSDFKPNHPPPYKVAISFAQLSNVTQTNIYNGLKKALESDPDYKVTAVTTGNQLNIPQQQQQFTTLLNAKPDIIIVEPLTDAFGPLVDKAGKQGIPTISFQGTTDSKYAINIQGNTYGTAAGAASYVFRQMKGTGNTLFMHGLASTTVDADYYNAYKAALKNCPNIKQVGELAGAFVSPTAKAETLKYLATHTGQVDGVLELGGMSPGIMSAFKQAGRPMPLVVDAAGMKGSLGFWANSKDDYHGYGNGFPPTAYGVSVASIAKRILAGKGLKISDITDLEPPITPDNLDQWGKTEWNLETPGVSEGPPQNFMSEKYLSVLFNDPSPVK